MGFEAYQKVIDAGVDLVLFATPPHFRPIHYAAAVKAGRHVFLEKPCCVDAPGYRQLLAANEVAKAKRLSVVVGLQRRHQPLYLEKIKKIRDGAVGQIRLVRTYYNASGTRPGASAGGDERDGVPDPLLEPLLLALRRSPGGAGLPRDRRGQLDHGLPSRPAPTAWARQIRTGPGTGDIYDRHMIEFEYADGTRHYCQARQQPGTWEHVSENVHGTLGEMTLGVGAWGLGARITPRMLRSKEFLEQNPYQREHEDLMASIRGDGPYRCEADYGASQHHDGRHGTHGHLFREVGHVGRGHPVRVATGPGPLCLGRPAAHGIRRPGELSHADSGRHAGVVNRAVVGCVQTIQSERGPNAVQPGHACGTGCGARPSRHFADGRRITREFKYGRQGQPCDRVAVTFE